jgi:hypothetical protein
MESTQFVVAYLVDVNAGPELGGRWNGDGVRICREALPKLGFLGRAICLFSMPVKERIRVSRGQCS